MANGYRPARGARFNGPLLWRLRHVWGIAKPPVGATGTPPADATPYSVAGAAAAVGVFAGTIYKWLHTGRLRGAQHHKHRAWVIYLSETEIARLRAHADRIRPSRKEAP